MFKIKIYTHFQISKLSTIIYIILSLGNLHNTDAQARNDYNWILGFPPNISDKYFGGVKIDFNHNLPLVQYFNTNCDAFYPAVLNSATGRLLFYSNGCSIFNSNHEIMQGGDTIAYGGIWDSYCPYVGYPGTQNHLLLPWPGDTTKAILLYLKSNDNITTYILLYAIIQIDNENPLGVVSQKDQFLVEPGTTALLTATKHANGRDWWIILPENRTNRFFTFLLSPTGVKLVSTQSIGEAWGEREGSSQAIFTPDGTKYIRFNPWKGLDIFNFDRCTGMLSNPNESGPLSFPIREASGIAASLDSRYLYASNVTMLYQYDLAATNIFATQYLIDEYDGYLDPFAVDFYQMALAPDGKIYVFSTNGNKSIGVIHNPKSKGALCNFTQHNFELPAYIEFGSINLPYYRLGPKDGSSCDTLGLNNIPIAYFTYQTDTLDPLNVAVTDLSYFNPVEYAWSFGDNTGSTLKDPAEHLYSNTGIYNVCLTVKNEYGENTFCRLIALDTTVSTDENPFARSILVSPNPFKDEIAVENQSDLRGLKLTLISNLGSIVFESEVFDNHYNTDLSAYFAGIYFYMITQDGTLIKSGKLIKL